MTTVTNEKPESFFEHWLIMPKLLYFLLNMFVYTFHSLMGIYFLHKWHFTYYMYGYASSVIITNFFGAMIWSSLADKTGRYKTIIISTALLYTVVALALLYPVFQDESQKVVRYIYVFTMLALFNFFLSASFPLLDAQILGMLASNPKISKEQFGNQRMFGAFGHLTATMVSLFLLDLKNPFNQAMLQVFTTSVFCLAVWLGVPDVKPVKGGHHGHHGGHKSDKADAAVVPKNPVLACLANPSFVFFMIFIAASGIVRAVTTNFQKPIMYAITGGEANKTALPDIVRTFSEVFVYATAKYMKNAMGIYWVLAFSQVTGIARLWGYGLVDVASTFAFTIAFCLELLKGFNSGLISSSAIPIASNLAPLGCESTAQGLYSGNYSGLSMALGGIVGGAILQYLYKPTDSKMDQALSCQTMFNWISVASMIVTIGLVAKFIFVDRVMGIPGFPRRQSFHK